MNMNRLLVIAALAVLIVPPARANEPTDARMAGKKMHHQRMWREDKMDTNHDGMVSKDEWNNFHGEMFDKIDANHDGKITKDEFKAKHMAMMEKHKEWKTRHGGSTSMPPANNEAPSGSRSGGADGAGGWTAQ
jgi:hypothetical protein